MEKSKEYTFKTYTGIGVVDPVLRRVNENENIVWYYLPKAVDLEDSLNEDMGQVAPAPASTLLYLSVGIDIRLMFGKVYVGVTVVDDRKHLVLVSIKNNWDTVDSEVVAEWIVSIPQIIRKMWSSRIRTDVAITTKYMLIKNHDFAEEVTKLMSSKLQLPLNGEGSNKIVTVEGGMFKGVIQTAIYDLVNGRYPIRYIPSSFEEEVTKYGNFDDNGVYGNIKFNLRKGNGSVTFNAFLTIVGMSGKVSLSALSGLQVVHPSDTKQMGFATVEHDCAVLNINTYHEGLKIQNILDIRENDQEWYKSLELLKSGEIFKDAQYIGKIYAGIAIRECEMMNAKGIPAYTAVIEIADRDYNKLIMEIELTYVDKDVLVGIMKGLKEHLFDDITYILPRYSNNASVIAREKTKITEDVASLYHKDSEKKELEYDMYFTYSSNPEDEYKILYGLTCNQYSMTTTIEMFLNNHPDVKDGIPQGTFRNMHVSRMITAGVDDLFTANGDGFIYKLGNAYSAYALAFIFALGVDPDWKMTRKRDTDAIDLIKSKWDNYNEERLARKAETIREYDGSVIKNYFNTSNPSMNPGMKFIRKLEESSMNRLFKMNMLQQTGTYVLMIPDEFEIVKIVYDYIEKNICPIEQLSYSTDGISSGEVRFVDISSFRNITSTLPLFTGHKIIVFIERMDKNFIDIPGMKDLLAEYGAVTYKGTYTLVKEKATEFVDKVRKLVDATLKE